jgi:hypothetical protein
LSLANRFQHREEKGGCSEPDFQLERGEASEEVEWWRGGEVERWRGGVVEWWSGGVVEWWSGGEVEWWSGGEVEWWSGGVVECGCWRRSAAYG